MKTSPYLALKLGKMRLGNHRDKLSRCGFNYKLRYLYVSIAAGAVVNLVVAIALGGLGQLSWYSDSLPSERPGDQIPVGAIFRTRPDRPWGPPSLLYNGYRVSFSRVKRPGCGVVHPPHLVPRLKKECSYTSTRPLGLRGLF